MKKPLFFLVGLLVTFSSLIGCSLAKPSDSTPEPEIDLTLPANREVILATTTSTQDSGLLDILIPVFQSRTGYKVKTVAVGTGAALVMGQRGEADVLLVHAPDSEVPLVESGDVINRQLVMHNDFVIVGPPSDPASINGTTDAAAALAAIARSQSVFISRGDDSGTNKKELSLWAEAGIEPSGQSWYQETGQGMGATLTVTSEKQGYTLTDRATYLATRQNLSLGILTEGAPVLMNIYHVMQVNPAKSDKINGDGGKAFVDFMVATETQRIIKTFGVSKYGQPLFFPEIEVPDAPLPDDDTTEIELNGL